MLSWLYAAVAIAIAILIARVIIVYATTSGTVRQRLLATAKGSWTILTQYAVITGSAIAIFADKLLGILQLPEAQAFMQQRLSPEILGWVTLAIAILTIVARMRSLFASR